jgi:hypothetical protein
MDRDIEIAQQLLDLSNEDGTDPFVKDILKHMALLQIMPKEMKEVK